VARGNAARGAWARDAHRTLRRKRGKVHHTHHANHAGKPTCTHAYHAHHLEMRAARMPSTGGTRIAANGGAYAHSGSMHQDGRRCMEVGRSNKWNIETASKQPGAHTPERPQNPTIQLITTGAYPPVESNQKKTQKSTSSPPEPIHRWKATRKTQKSTSSSPRPIPDGKVTHIVRSGAASTASGAHAA
jgi:hypothetical protein